MNIKINFNKETQLLKIADNGIGIDMKRGGDKLCGLYKIFNDHLDSKGIGLLLKIRSKPWMVRFFADSELNAGTTFSIYFK
jgi:hypothetical protein